MKFDVSRLRRADQIIGVSAILFFVFVFFLHWYGASEGSFSVGVNGWHAFTLARWVWLLTIIVAIASVVVASGAARIKVPVQFSVLVAGLAALSTLLILYRVIHHPGGSVHGSFGGVDVTFKEAPGAGIKLGIWLALIASAALTYGGYLAMRSEGTSISDVREQASGALGNLSAQVSGSDSSDAPTVATPAPAAAETLPPPPPSPASNPPLTDPPSASS